MADKIKKCSKNEHKDIDGVSYCQDCKIIMCNKCLNLHQGLYENHHTNNLNNYQDIFTDLCKEENHCMKLEFYCKNHNTLCCANCITKIQAFGYGQHKDCKIFILQDIKEEKKNKLNDNIKYLEDLSKNMNDSIKELKVLFDKIETEKDELKTKIQNIFTKIRTALNEREDELLFEVDKKYKNLFDKEDIIKESEKLPNKIKISLEKGKSLNNDWNNNNLSSLLSICINIENNIEKMNLIFEGIKKYKINNNTKIEFNIKDENYDNFIKQIKSLGNIYDITDKTNLDSLILKNRDELNKFYNLLSSQIKINQIKLLFRSSRDGLTLNKLKEKINNKSNLIFLFLAGENRIFGSFIKAQIKVGNESYTKDKDAFVFSLNNSKIYKILIPEYAIYFRDDHPILIGNNYNGNGFWVYSGGIDEGSLANPKIYDFQKNNELLEGKQELKEMEIFEIGLN